ncbi:hypothetical protein BKH46_02155 [Helicobacter sp. 12S02634-8]|uniref:hypothetical protein n=1 Tax=Helicobacter sp. 12S02634-8 TaxID=1476199 RepID=UPI000BA705C8|nr:hypothetical protein [Helicobacter sp. 12S02634-8]PAF48134.1 hypothetical protein BKH46_02155 [Helicobacter sp. 12S02634-8]
MKSLFLYLSLFFKQHRDLYYKKLNEIRKTGDWEDWLNFFLECVAVTATDAKNTLLKIKKIFEADDDRVASIGRAHESAEAVLAEFKQKPLLTITEITKQIGFAKTTAIGAVNCLINLGIIKNISEKKWGQIYSYAKYINPSIPNEE